MSGLKKYDLNISAIVSMMDDGGSSGILRDEYGVLPPGDVRRALVALSDSGEILRALFNYRFENGSLNGHSFGNLLLAALEKITGNFSEAVYEASKILNIKGSVIPVTTSNCHLVAELSSGEIIKGETNIDIPRELFRSPIKKIWSEPDAEPNKDALEAIASADIIAIGPGDLYTSIIPNFLVRGIGSAIVESKAKKIYIGNLTTKAGETDNYSGLDFIQVIEYYLGADCLDASLWNNHLPNEELISKYSADGSQIVLPPSNCHHEIITGDLISEGHFIRHDSEKLGRLIKSLI